MFRGNLPLNELRASLVKFFKILDAIAEHDDSLVRVSEIYYEIAESGSEEEVLELANAVTDFDSDDAEKD